MSVIVSVALEEVLHLLARESGRALAELGVRDEDEDWIRQHARTVASLAGRDAPRSGLRRLWRRLTKEARRRLRNGGGLRS